MDQPCVLYPVCVQEILGGGNKACIIDKGNNLTDKPVQYMVSVLNQYRGNAIVNANKSSSQIYSHN